MNRRTISRIGHLLAITLIVALVLLTVGLSSAAAQGSQPVACVTAYRLNVRSGPGLTYPVISGLSLNQCVTLAGYRNADATWVQVQLPTGGTGWVSAYYISTAYPIAGLTVAAGTPPAAPSPPPASAWRGEYYSNAGLIGTPAMVRSDSAINFYWFLGAPVPGLPADYFSVRWTRTDQFEGAGYRFHAVVDDGVRLWVDGQLIIDAWQDGPAREFVADRTLISGPHSLRVEYYEHGGFAQVRVWWERLSSPTSYSGWKGEYFTNTSLAGSPALVRNDASVDFNWGLGAPAPGLSADNFSIRWTRTDQFEAATYRFHAAVDDGVRLWVDGQLVIDAWRHGGVRELSSDLALAPGAHSLRVEYFESAGLAEIRVWWERLWSTTLYSSWKGEYFSNSSLTGTPTVVRNDSNLEFNWGLGTPAWELPADNFSIRWTGSVHFDGATYRFHAVVDDGLRLWIDDQRIIDAWSDGGAREIVADRTLSQGSHTLRVEYYERAGYAQVRVWWEKVSSSYPEWQGEYFSNRKLEGSPTLVRNDKKIEFNWKDGRPASSLPKNSFSARWTRTREFDAATYRFHAVVDDGVRLWVGDRLVIDAWKDGPAREVTADRAMVKGNHTVRVEYYEREGNAQIRVWWEKITPTFTEWRGEYWDNRELKGSPDFVRNDANIDFNWKEDRPASGLPKDNFSIRWTRDVEFAPGTYRFYARADDGIRVYIDGERVLNEWHDSDGGKDYRFDRTLEGKHTLRVDYYERGGKARVGFRWEKL